MRTWRHLAAILGLLLAVLCQFFASPTPALAAATADFPIAGGHFYSEANGQGGGPGQPGFTITNDGGIPFWSTFAAAGGISALGYPISQRFVSGAFVYQATQKALLQWDGAHVTIANVLDQLHTLGFDPVLQARFFTPPPIDNSADTGLPWPLVVARHEQLLATAPLLQAAYVAVPNPILLYGLPMTPPTPEANGAVIVVRLQRAVLQLWTTAQPWAAANQVTVANAGDILKSLGLLPASSLAPVAPPTPATVSSSAVSPGSSDNWAGYYVQTDPTALQTGVFTDVRGSWTVPTVDCSKTPNGSVGVWVGLDGVSSITVEQAGTSSDCEKGSAQYSAWMEVFPSDPRTAEMTIQPGDQITAEVQYLGDQVFRLSLRDETTGQGFSVRRYSPGNLSSAEWVVEAPLTGHGIAPLAAFSPITVSSASVTANGQSGAIQNPSWSTAKITMTDTSGNARASVSPLDPATDSFTVTWLQQ
ncbi:MAG: G1 family endopeptidase [Chloroflexi bacterium]|nr:G1 family endopeptidase [Chloroflexota bacterium]